MNLKKVYLIVLADKYELPIACFDNLIKVSNYLGKNLLSTRVMISRNSIKFRTGYKIIPTIIDRDDEEEDPKFIVTAKYKSGEFFGEYKTYETAKECAFKLSRMKCKVIDIREKATNHLLLYIDNTNRFLDNLE